MSKMVRVKLLLLLTLIVAYGGAASPGYPLPYCPNYSCGDVPDFCYPTGGTGCKYIRYTYVGACGEDGVPMMSMYKVSCAVCPGPDWAYCHV